METGITFGQFAENLVPEFEEREAAVYCHYAPLEFEGLPVEERARCVAQYRLHRLVELHAEDAVNAAIDRQRTQGRKRNG